MGIAVIYGGFLSLWFFNREGKPESEDVPITGTVIISAIIGARLAHVFFYDWPFYSVHPEQILMVWKGGLASHGAIIGMVLGIWLYCRITGKLYHWWVFDRVALATPFAAGLIRIGNLFNSELYGKATDVPWAFVFTRVDNVPRHPVQLYEALGYFIVAIIMFSYYLRNWKTMRYGTLTAMFLVMANTVRFFMEYFKDMPEVLGPFTMGQWLSLPFIMLGVVIWWLSQRGRFEVQM
jgi:prolipoprotein diacylglyceryl transferase